MNQNKSTILTRIPDEVKARLMEMLKPDSNVLFVNFKHK